MENQSPSRGHRHRDSQSTYGTNSPYYSSQSPRKPPPVASVSPSRDARERRRRGKTSEARSIPHNGATCNNNSCDAPDVAPHERLCPGPEGLRLCARCYKRFKIERRRAKEAQRAITDDWKIPKRRSTRSTTPLPADEQKSSTCPADAFDPAQSERSPPAQNDELPARHRENKYRNEAPSPQAHNREFAKQPAAIVAPRSGTEKSSSLFNFPTSSLKEYGQMRAHRKHRSRNERDHEKHMRNGGAGAPPTYSEAEFYKYGREEGDDYFDERGCCGAWSRRRRCVVIGLVVLSVIILVIVIVLAATLSRKKDGFKYVPSTAQVNSTLAFASGGATRDNVNDTTIGIGAGSDTYHYYQGNASNFPPKEQWVTFKDMWEKNLDTFRNSCRWLGHGENNTPEMIQDIYDAIQDRANASLVDHRIILGTIIQETNGCPLNPSTTSSGGTRNPGLMQSHNGHEYDPKHSRLSIFQMIQDGTQGTEHGWGLVDNLNTYGNPYKAMRGYNSGYIPTSGDLSEASGATACYVSDIANRLTGWVRAESTCPGDKAK